MTRYDQDEAMNIFITFHMELSIFYSRWSYEDSTARLAGFLSGFASKLSASRLENEASAEWNRNEEENNGGWSYSVLPPMQQVFLRQNIMMSETIIGSL